jgi:hypothetical protein
MTEDEARKLLPQYADGLLKPEQARELEEVLAQSPALQSELVEIEEKSIPLEPLSKGDNLGLSEELLTEALAPLRPSRSARIRLSDAMQDVHRHAEYVANTMPERGWRIFRLGFGLVATAIALLLWIMFPRTTRNEDGQIFYLLNFGVFMIGILFLLLGRLLAKAEALVIGAISQKEVKPTRLEVLMLEVFGIVSVLSAGVLYLYHWH